MIKSIDMVATGENIKRRCEWAGLSPTDLSRILDLDLSTIYYWFQGKSLPRWEVAINLADLCDCRLEDLIVLEVEDE